MQLLMQLLMQFLTQLLMQFLMQWHNAQQGLHHHTMMSGERGLQSCLMMLQSCQMMLWRQGCSNGVLSDDDTALVHDCVCVHMLTNSRAHKQVSAVHFGKSHIVGTDYAQSCNQ